MATSVGEIALDLVVQRNSISNSITNSVNGATPIIQGLFTKLAGVASAAFTAKKIFDFGKESIQLASDLAEIQNVVDVTFGESANVINEFATITLEKFGLSETAAKQYSSTIGAIAKSVGLSKEEIMTMSTGVTQLAGDFASFYNLDSETAFNKLRSGITGEIEPLRQLGINLSQANLQAFAMSQGIDKSITKMTESEKVTLRYNYILAQTTDAQGDFARTSDSFANQQRLLTENWDSLKAVLGDFLIKAALPLTVWLNEAVKAVSGFATQSEGFIQNLSSTWNQHFGKILEDNSGFITKLTEGFKAFYEGFLKPVTETLLTNLKTVWEEHISGIIDNVTKFWEKFKEIFTFLTDFFITIVVPLLKEGGTLMVNVFTGTLDLILDVIDNLMEKFQGLLDFVIDILDTMSGAWGDNTETITTTISNFIEKITGFFKKLYDEFLKPVTDTFLAGFKKVWDENISGILENIKLFVKDFMEAFNSVVKFFNENIYPEISEILDKLTNFFFETIVPLFKNLFQTVSDIFGDILDTVMGVIDGVITVIRGLLKIVTGIFTGDFEKVFEGFKLLFKGTFDIIGSVLKGAINIIISLVNSMIRGLNSIKVTVPEWLSNLPGMGWLAGKTYGINIPQIPKLAEGGIIQAPTLALVGDNKNVSTDPEVVAPLSKLTKFMQNNPNSSSNNILDMNQVVILLQSILQELRRNNTQKSDVVLKVSETELGRMAIKGINTLQRQHGRNLLRV